MYLVDLVASSHKNNDKKVNEPLKRIPCFEFHENAIQFWSLHDMCSANSILACFKTVPRLENFSRYGPGFGQRCC